MLPQKVKVYRSSPIAVKLLLLFRERLSVKSATGHFPESTPQNYYYPPTTQSNTDSSVRIHQHRVASCFPVEIH